MFQVFLKKCRRKYGTKEMSRLFSFVLRLTKQSKLVYHGKSYSFETDFG